MPAFDSNVFSHLVMVDKLTGWCGLIVAVNSFEVCSLKALYAFLICSKCLCPAQVDIVREGWKVSSEF